MKVSTPSAVAITTIVGLLGIFEKGYAFSVVPATKRSFSVVTQHRMNNSDDNNDPTKVWYAEIANGIQNILTNSPLNEGKKALVKALAGDYDEIATKAKLEGLISDHPVVMLSFVK
mmetsp:Transcript_4170/g.6322  ORF Transcript_4170/g.6322 Transcript_4170/m.6322 type:complete len:116 (-) Transcript_4170:501-848(-)